MRPTVANPTPLDEADLVRRAFAAYFRSGGTEQPANTSEVRIVQGKAYVVLDNVHGILAVYGVRPVDGVLKRLKRWPAALEGN